MHFHCLPPTVCHLCRTCTVRTNTCPRLCIIYLRRQFLIAFVGGHGRVTGLRDRILRYLYCRVALLRVCSCQVGTVFVTQRSTTCFAHEYTLACDSNEGRSAQSVGSVRHLMMTMPRSAMAIASPDSIKTAQTKSGV